MIIRHIKEEDLDVLSDIFVKVFHDTQEPWTKERALILIRHYLSRYPDMCNLAEVDGKIVGGYLTDLKPCWDGLHMVDGDLFLLPEYHGKMIGSQLIARGGRVALEKYKATRVDTYTFKNRLPWYEKRKFHHVKDWYILTGDIKEIVETTEKKF